MRLRPSARSPLALAATAVVLLASACGDPSSLRSQAERTSNAETTSGGSPVGRWRPTAPSPLTPRHSSVAVTVGREVLFLGGQDEEVCPPNADCAIPPHRLPDGAAYDPAADVWRRTAPAPVGLSLGAETAVVDGVVYVLITDTRDNTDVTFLSYDVRRDRWTTLAAPPGGGYLRLVAAHGAVVAYQSTHEHGPPLADQVYDVAARSWAALPLDPLVPSFDRTLVWAGDRAVLLAPRLVAQPGGADGPSWLRAATLDLRSRTWRALPETRQVIGGELMPVWTGRAVLNPSPRGADGGDTNGYGRTIPFGGRLEIGSGQWAPLPPAPEERRGRGVVAVSPSYSAVGSAVLDEKADRWVQLPAPEDPDVHGHAAAWVGDRLVVWGGARMAGDGGELVASGQVWAASD